MKKLALMFISEPGNVALSALLAGIGGDSVCSADDTAQQRLSLARCSSHSGPEELLPPHPKTSSKLCPHCLQLR